MEAAEMQTMRELPLLMNGAMVRAVLEGRKTVTRRVVKPQPRAGTTHYAPNWRKNFIDGHFMPMAGAYVNGGGSGEAWSDAAIRCPYGEVGDRLWVKEAWRVPASLDVFSGSDIAEKCMAAGYRSPWAPIRFEADGALNSAKDWREFGSTPGEATPGRYRNARFMPRWASRITLEVAAVRVERLQNVDQQQAMAEGIDGEALFRAQGYAPLAFERLWESINGAGSWATNPWVWVVEFRRVEVTHG